VNNNLLLGALPRDERARLEPYLHPVSVPDGTTLIRAGEPIESIWFFEDALGAIVQVTRDGSQIPSGLSGYEGVAGFELWLRHHVSPLSTLVPVGGRMRRMDARDLEREVLQTRSPLNDLLADFVFGYLTLASQLSVCNRQHSLEERLCRWLRMISVRLPEKKSFRFQDGFLASLLGAEPSTAAITARVLRNAGLIDFHEPEIRILDEQGLEDGACECYPIFHAHFERFRRHSA
jgi:CRP-like cAMP-binding protein